MANKYANYGEKFDKPIATLMGLLILGAFVGVIMLQRAAKKECQDSLYTYCDGTDTQH